MIDFWGWDTTFLQFPEIIPGGGVPWVWENLLARFIIKYGIVQNLVNPIFVYIDFIFLFFCCVICFVFLFLCYVVLLCFIVVVFWYIVIVIVIMWCQPIRFSLLLLLCVCCLCFWTRFIFVVSILQQTLLVLRVMFVLYC